MSDIKSVISHGSNRYSVLLIVAHFLHIYLFIYLFVFFLSNTNNWQFHLCHLLFYFRFSSFLNNESSCTGSSDKENVTAELSESDG
jgi:hypothetical protein